MSVYTALTSEQALQEAWKESDNHPVAFFKHSTRCSVSRMVWNGMEREARQNQPETPIFYIDLLAHRSVSNLLTQLSDVRHESPQLIVVHKQTVIHASSHEDISFEALTVSK